LVRDLLVADTIYRGRKGTKEGGTIRSMYLREVNGARARPEQGVSYERHSFEVLTTNAVSYYAGL